MIYLLSFIRITNIFLLLIFTRWQKLDNDLEKLNVKIIEHLVETLKMHSWRLEQLEKKIETNKF